MNKTTLLQLNKRGIFPSPNESEEEFLKRSSELLSNCELPFKRIEELFGIVPDWLDFEFSNRGLSFWHGGMTTIENGKYQVQIRKNNLFSNLYPHEEIMAHESVHAMRASFNEPFFEEIVAYQTSRYFWRRFLGPIFQFYWEGVIFISSITLLLISSILSLYSPIFLSLHSFIFLLVGVIGIFLFTKLFILQAVFFRCKSRLAQLLNNEKKVLSLMLRLKDREIFSFAFFSILKIRSYLINNKNKSLRSKLIYYMGFESCDVSE